MSDEANMKDVLYMLFCIYLFTIPPLGIVLTLKSIWDDLGLSWSGIVKFIEEFNSGLVDGTIWPMN